MGSLSGGNQQRFVAGRALELYPKLILAFQPARGLDLNSTTKVYQEIRRRCDEGATAVIVSFDLDELLDFCDRILVMNHGELFEPKPEEARDRTAIGRLMVGAA
jgi:simple sugar transport system ATP-binding protein